jgi:hypothetical protein
MHMVPRGANLLESSDLYGDIFGRTSFDARSAGAFQYLGTLRSMILYVEDREQHSLTYHVTRAWYKIGRLGAFFFLTHFSDGHYCPPAYFSASRRSLPPVPERPSGAASSWSALQPPRRSRERRGACFLT